MQMTDAMKHCFRIFALALLLLWIAPEAAAQRGTRLRVMTYNIHHGESLDGELDLAAIADVIRSSGADVVGLQEVDRHWSDRSRFNDQLAELAERLHMYAFWGPIYNLPSTERGHPSRGYGLAVLSRYPILEAKNYELTRLPSVGENPERIVMPGFPMATIDVRGTPLHVYNTHQDYRSDPAVRTVQTRETMSIMARTEGVKVLMGDLNAEPEAEELAPIREVMTDSWDVAGRGDGFTFPAGDPVKRIDHIYVSPGIEVVSVDVLQTAASDHRPVVAVLELPRTTTSGNTLRINSETQPSRPNVLHRAHAHNDYEHERPLLDALDHGFRSIEADIHLIDGELLVAHDREDTVPGRTLQSLYLDPLSDRIRRNGGSVYGEGTTLILLVDVKSEAEPTYAVLRAVLREYGDIVTTYAGDEATERAVTVVVSGNRAREAMLDEEIRYAAYDGRPQDLTEHANAPPAFIPLVSAPWYGISAWRGEGPLPELDRKRLRTLVRSAHGQGRMLRFWATADTATVWEALVEENVDLIGADDLSALHNFLRDE